MPEVIAARTLFCDPVTTSQQVAMIVAFLVFFLPGEAFDQPDAPLPDRRGGQQAGNGQNDSATQ